MSSAIAWVTAEEMEIVGARLTAESVAEIGLSAEVPPEAQLGVRADKPLPPGIYPLSMEFTNEFNSNAVGFSMS